MQSIIDIITAIRNIRSQWNIKPNEKVDVFIIPADFPMKDFLIQNSDDIKRIGKVKELSIDNKEQVIKNAATTIIGTIKVIVPLEGLIDLEAEKKKMTGEILQKKKSIEGLNSRLNNQDFTSKAPVEIITKEKERLELLNKEIQALEAALTKLS